MRITEEEKQKIAKAIKKEKIRKHLHEEKDQRELRKAREYCETYNRENRCELKNGVKGAKCETANHRYVKNEKGEWEIENVIFKIHNKHKWEDHDEKHNKIVKKETCILYEDQNIVVVNAIVEIRSTKKYDIYEPDRNEEKIIMSLPKYKLKFEVEKMREFKRMPKNIFMDGVKYSTNELFAAILETGKNIYRVK